MVCHALHFNFNTVQLDYRYTHTLHKYTNLVVLLHIHDILLLVYPACSKLKYYASEDADCRTSARSLFPSARTTLSLSLSVSALFSAQLQGAALSSFS